MNCKVIYRALDFLPVPKFADMPDQQIRLKSIRMIIIDPAAFLKGQIVPAPVIIVLIDNRYLFTEGFLQPVGEGGFSGAGAAGDSDKKRFPHSDSPLSFCQHNPYYLSLQD